MRETGSFPSPSRARLGWGWFSRWSKSKIIPLLSSPFKGAGHNRRCSRFRRSSFAPLFVLVAHAATAEPLENHYNDPFIQITRANKNCPLPRGPFMTLQEARAEAHPRIERGTTCFRARKCTEPNSYRYDARIAQAAQLAATAAVLKSPSLSDSSVWITVQRRFIFVHGCVARREQIARWETLFRRVSDVEYVGADLAVMAAGKLPKRVPYPIMPPP